MAADPGTRFHHLLQPIRDLSKVWNIEIADELEKYIDEVASLSFETQHGSKKVNFAEAALLIQGSMAVYSRKVEQLYALVYQALGQLTANKEKAADAQGRRKPPNGLWAPIPETDELLTIDHLIKEGRNITLDDTAFQRQDQRQAMNRRLPLFLMPRDRSEGKQEFRISSCSVHSSGAYLIHKSDAQMLEAHLVREGVVQNTPLVPPPPSEVRDLDEQLQVLLRGRPESDQTGPTESSAEPPFGDAPFENEAPAPPGDDGFDSPLCSLIREPPPAAVNPTSADPWALLDEDLQVGQNVPPEAGSCTRRFGTKGLLAKGEGLPAPGTWEPLSDKELWRPGGAADGLSTLLASGHPVESLFLVVGTYLRNGGRTETERAGFSAAWLELEDLFLAASSKRKGTSGKTKAMAEAALHEAPQTPTAGCLGADSDDEPAPFTPPRAWAREASPPRGDWDQVDPADQETSLLDEHRQQVAKLEGMIEDAQTEYESSVRSRLQRMQGSEANGQAYPELYENVRVWQEQLAPVLKEFESHPEFDINTYGGKFISKMLALGEEDELETKAVPFSRLVHGQPRWEVCRRFLTCLFLTTQGNTDIVFESESERVNNFGVSLLKAEATHLTLYGEEDASRVDSRHDPLPLPSTPTIPEGRKSSPPRIPDHSPAHYVHAAVHRAPTPLQRQGQKRSRESFESAF
jgi:condensin-2 complex subunit H2